MRPGFATIKRAAIDGRGWMSQPRQKQDGPDARAGAVSM